MASQRTRVIVQEVGMRDGLQSLPDVMPTGDKKKWIDAAYAAGVRHMEVASFVPARLLPQMADAEQVIAHALSLPDLVVTALVPNLKGAEKALAAGALYAVERQAQELDADQRCQLRQQQGRPAADTLHAWPLAQRRKRSRIQLGTLGSVDALSRQRQRPDR